jgi:bifunctional non-homologous end joining protein LigD
MQPRLVTRLPDGASWRYQPVPEGHRVVLVATPQGVSINAGGEVVDELARAALHAAARDLARARGQGMVLDGFVRFATAMTRRESTLHRSALAFEAIDCLALDGRTVHDRPWAIRHAELETLVRSARAAWLRVVPAWRGTADAALRRARDASYHAVVAKRTDAPYLPSRRSADWQQLHVDTTAAYPLIGWTPAADNAALPGALIVGRVDRDGRLRYAGAVELGISATERLELRRRLPSRPGPSRRCDGIAHLGNLQWTTAALRVRVRCDAWAPNGEMQRPVYLGILDDQPR